MGDEGLEALRAKRLQELQAKHPGMESEQQKQQQQERQQEMMNSILTQILDQNARARLNSIALVKPEKAKQVERILVSMAQRGQIGDKMNDSQLVALLGEVSGKSQKTTVKFERRRVMDSDSESD